MADVAKTACRRCREQKLKCSKERPVCARCHRLEAACGYPSPPDRRAIAAQRATQKRRHSDDDDGEEFQSSELDQSVPIAASHPTSYESMTNDLPAPLQNFLLDVFFLHMWNASLIFHRASFSEALQRDAIPEHNLLAIYATATIFLTPNSKYAKTNAFLLHPLGDLQATGRQWAIQAGRMALANIDEPRVSTIRTCKMLEMYWFARGESGRNIMLNGVAINGASVLGFNKKKPDAVDDLGPPTDKQCEAIHRLFCTIWITHAANSDLSKGLSRMDVPVLLEHDTDVECDVTQSLSGIHCDHIQVSVSSQILANLISITLLWAQIRDHVEKRRHNPKVALLDEMFALEARLASWLDQLPKSLTYSKRNLYEQLIILGQPVYTLLYALYHQSRLVLHASLVPLFSGLPMSETLSSDLVSMSAQTGLLSAQKISQLGADILALDYCPSHLAAFVGYCMYVSASTQLVLLGSREIGLASQARNNLISNLKLLRVMKDYWSNLEKLVRRANLVLKMANVWKWDRLVTLYEIQRTRPTLPTNRTSNEASPGVLQEVARQRRYTGSLTEPLSDSVLQYTLQNLRSSGKSPQSSMGLDALSQLLEQELSNPFDPIRDADTGFKESAAPHQMISPQYVAGISDAQAVMNFPEMSFNYAFDALPYSIEDVQQAAMWADPVTNTHWSF